MLDFDKFLKHSLNWKKNSNSSMEISCLVRAIKADLIYSLRNEENVLLRKEKYIVLIKRIHLLSIDTPQNSYQDIADISFFFNEISYGIHFLKVKQSPKTKFWNEYSKAQLSILEDTSFSIPENLNPKGIQKTFISFFKIAMSKAITDSILAEAQKYFLKRNSDKRYTDYSFFAGDGFIPVKWDFYFIVFKNLINDKLIKKSVSDGK